MTDRDLLAEGRRLLDKASSGPWDFGPHCHIEKGCRCLLCHDPATVWFITNMLGCEDVPVPDGADQERCDEYGHTFNDAEFIVWARNSLAAVFDELETLRARAGDA